MKYIALSVLGLVLLAAIGAIVLWANMPTAKLTVHAVRPVGTNSILSIDLGQTLPSSVWEVAITNNGRAPAWWYPRLRHKNADGVTSDEVPWPCSPEIGRLSPGQYTNIYMFVPSDRPGAWSVALQYQAPMTPLEMRLYLSCRHSPKLRRLLPNYAEQLTSDVWHTGTNVTTAR